MRALEVLQRAYVRWRLRRHARWLHRSRVLILDRPDPRTVVRNFPGSPR